MIRFLAAIDPLRYRKKTNTRQPIINHSKSSEINMFNQRERTFAHKTNRTHSINLNLAPDPNSEVRIGK